MCNGSLSNIALKQYWFLGIATFPEMFLKEQRQIVQRQKAYGGWIPLPLWLLFHKLWQRIISEGGRKLNAEPFVLSLWYLFRLSSEGSRHQAGPGWGLVSWAREEEEQKWENWVNVKTFYWAKGKKPRWCKHNPSPPPTSQAGPSQPLTNSHLDMTTLSFVPFCQHYCWARGLVARGVPWAVLAVSPASALPTPACSGEDTAGRWQGASGAQQQPQPWRLVKLGLATKPNLRTVRVAVKSEPSPGQSMIQVKLWKEDSQRWLLQGKMFKDSILFQLFISTAS